MKSIVTLRHSLHLMLDQQTLELNPAAIVHVTLSELTAQPPRFELDEEFTHLEVRQDAHNLRQLARCFDSIADELDALRARATPQAAAEQVPA